MVLSADTQNDPDVFGINGASVALAVSDIPFHGPIGAVRVGLVEGKFIINPTYDEQREGEAEPDGRRHRRRHRDDRVRRERSVGRRRGQAIEFGHGEIKKICAAISELAKEVGKPKREVARRWNSTKPT